MGKDTERVYFSKRLLYMMLSWKKRGKEGGQSTDQSLGRRQNGERRRKKANMSGPQKEGL